MSLVVNAENIIKTYGDLTALNNITIQVESGSIVGLIGPDGAGKSSLMKIILTLESFDKGNVQVMGKDLHSGKAFIRNNVGYMPEIFSLYTDLSVEENLKFYFRIHRMDANLYEEKLDKLYKFNRLQKFSKTLSGQLSGGMKQKLALSCALVHNPVLLVLDEPTTGVDPLSRKEFWKMLHELKNEGITILVSTPYMDEATLCDYVYLIHSGKILSKGKPAEIVTEFAEEIYELSISEPQKNISTIRNFLKNQTVFLSGKKVHLSLKKGFNKKALKESLYEMDKSFTLKKIAPSLEDLFFTLILQNGDVDAK